MQAGADDGGHRVRIAARMDRRKAEAVVLQLRQRLRRLGLHGATITVTPSRRQSSTPAGDGTGQPGAASV